MSQKQKTIENVSEQFSATVQRFGLGLMVGAALAGLVELPDKASKVILPSQPAFELAGLNEKLENNPIRREREEAGPHYVSYAVAQRTPGRSSKQ